MNKKYGLSFLSESEERELTFALCKISDKIERGKDRKTNSLEDASLLLDPKLVYTWWERNYDDEFTRSQVVHQLYFSCSHLLLSHFF